MCVRLASWSCEPLICSVSLAVLKSSLQSLNIFLSNQLPCEARSTEMAILGTATSACSLMCSPTVLKYDLTSSIPEKSLEIFSNCLKAAWIMSSQMAARISGSALGK